LTLDDLQAAIAECKGERNPNANTCYKLAAYFILMQNLYPESSETLQNNAYSLSPVPDDSVEETVDYYSDTEFSRLINGKYAASIWKLMDELMTTLQAIQPRLYEGVLRKLREMP